MERKFTLRINATETDQLQRIKDLSGESTDTGAIRFVINNYVKLNELYLIERDNRKSLQVEISKLKERVKDFLSAFKELGKGL